MFKRLIFASLLTATTVVTAATSVQNNDSYQQALEEMRAMSKKSKSNLTEDDRATMKLAAKRLKAAMPSPGIKVGEKAPDFELSDAFGNRVKLSDELKKGPVVLVFYRGAWCPYCNLHLHVLQKNLDKFKAHGAQLITISPQKPDKSAEQVKKDGYQFHVLSDLDSSVMQNYKLYFEMEPEILKIYEKFELDLETYNGKGRTVLPVPGGFVIDSNGIVRAAKAQTDYKARMEPAEIIEALKKING